MQTLAVTVITKNEAHVIRACLESVKWADEIIVLDSGSTDETVRICREYTDKVFVTDWPGYGPQKNRALAYATSDWVLSLDADEQVSPALGAEIKALLGAPNSVHPLPYSTDSLFRSLGKSNFQAVQQHEESALSYDEPQRRMDQGCNGMSSLVGEPCVMAYAIPRLSTYCGKVVYYGDWRKDYCKRLFKRGYANFENVSVHESLTLEGNGKWGKLSGHLFHATFNDLEEMLYKLNHFSSLSAKMRQEKADKVSIWTAIGHGLWTFLRGYLFKLGFLDGREGFMLAVSNAEGTYYRYLKLMYLQSKPPTTNRITG